MKRLLDGLAPYLDGTNDIISLCERVEPAYRAKTATLLVTLIEQGIIDSNEDEVSDLSDIVKNHFRSQIDFLSQLTDKAESCFSQFRNSRVVIFADGPAALSCGSSLIRNGLSRLTYAQITADGVSIDALNYEQFVLSDRGISSQVCVEDPSSVSLPTPSPAAVPLVIYATRSFIPGEIVSLQHSCAQFHCALLPIIVNGVNATTGPILDCTRAGCWCCAMMCLQAGPSALLRWLLDSETVNFAPNTEDIRGDFSATVGAIAARDAVKFLAGNLRRSSTERLLVHSLNSENSMSTTSHPFALDSCMGYCQRLQ